MQAGYPLRRRQLLEHAPEAYRANKETAPHQPTKLIGGERFRIGPIRNHDGGSHSHRRSLLLSVFKTCYMLAKSPGI